MPSAATRLSVASLIDGLKASSRWFSCSPRRVPRPVRPGQAASMVSVATTLFRCPGHVEDGAVLAAIKEWLGKGRRETCAVEAFAAIKPSTRTKLRTARPQLRDRFPRQRVGALVEVVAGMAAHPMPVHGVAGDGGVEALPQVDILDRLLVGGFPA